MAVYDIEAVAALQAEGTWRGAGFDRQDEAATWWSAGFHATEAQRWASAARYFFRSEPEPVASNHAVFAAMAQSFKASDFTPEEMRLWRDALEGVDVKATLHEARRWRAAGFPADEAARWRRWGLLTGERDLEFAVLFANAGWTWDHVAALTLLSRERGTESWDDARRAWTAFLPPMALNFAKAGVSPEHARLFEQLSLQPQVLVMELRARHEALPPLDPYLAMHLNDVLDRMSAGQPNEMRPFFAEHLHDVRDEAAQGNGTSPAVHSDDAIAAMHSADAAAARHSAPRRDPAPVEQPDHSTSAEQSGHSAPAEQSGHPAVVDVTDDAPVHSGQPGHVQERDVETGYLALVDASPVDPGAEAAADAHAEAAFDAPADASAHTEDAVEHAAMHAAPAVVNLNGTGIFEGTQEAARGSMAEALTGEIPVRAAWPFPRKSLPGMS